METCERCGIMFDPDEEADEFLLDETLDYEKMKPCLCSKCALEAAENEEEDVFFETCECCGKEFDVFADEYEYESHFTWDTGLSFRMAWSSEGKILCADCAIDAVEELSRNDEEYDEENTESLSAYDAALIWASHGKDEDYTFGYTEEELEEALN